MSVPRRPQKAGRRPDVEKWLSDHGVEFEYWPDFPIDEIDLEKSLHNQARMFEPLDDTVVRQYAEAFSRGDHFPAVVLAKTNARQKATAIDGPSARVTVLFKRSLRQHPWLLIRCAVSRPVGHGRTCC